MATDFFQRQAEARRSTKWLVGMFLLAVVAIVVALFFVATLAVRGYSQYSELQHLDRGDVVLQDDWTVPIGVSLFGLVLIGGGTLFKVAQLRGGGTTVAENVGGRRIMPNTTDLVEKRILNVVEEMALASGVPVPPVYLLNEEQGINAFAAGYSPSDAVVAVTRGTAEQLSRDELQGVVAHEFSHILNGDMRLNIRLIGILHGILLLGLIGRILFRVAHYGSYSSRRNNAGMLLLVGLVLIVLGSIGTLMGNLIKAAVSRQREYLADASAVQFTRNPGGIAGALKRIGAAMFGSKVNHPSAAEVSHMYFGQGVWEGFTGMMATHPPLRKRITRLEPNWNGKFPKMPDTPIAYAELGVAASLAGGRPRYREEMPAETVEQTAAQIGHPEQIHQEYASALIAELPEVVRDSAHDPYGARALLFALLLDDKPEVREVQMQALANLTSTDMVEMTKKLAPTVDALEARVRLPVVDMALPALRAMSKPQYDAFSRAFRELVRADRRLDLFEWTLHRILLRHLQPQFEKTAPPRVAYYNMKRLGQPCSVLLSTLAYAGSTPEEARRSFDKAATHLPNVPLKMVPLEECGLSQIDAALDELRKVTAKHQQRLVQACAVAVCADQQVKVREAELLRGIADMLDCPMPPLLPGQEVSGNPFPQQRTRQPSRLSD